MREILFRGKRIDNGEWVEGYYGEFHNRPTVQRENSCQIFEPREDAYICGSYIGGLWHVVDRKTVGQFTGLTDKNGKKIFEGDVVESKFTKKPYIVRFGEYTYTNEYGEEECACGLYNEEADGYVTPFGCPENWASVIGNIHDNPELLKGGAENE